MSRQSSQSGGDLDPLEQELMSLRPLPVDRSIADQLSLKLDEEPPIAWHWRAAGLVAAAAGFLIVVLGVVEKLKSPIRVPGPPPIPARNDVAEQVDPNVRPFTLAAYQTVAAQGPRALESLLDEQAMEGRRSEGPTKISTAGGGTVN